MTLAITLLSPIPLIREGIRALLADERDFQITPLALSDDWFEELLAEKPAVLLLDVLVLEREGWAVLDELRRAIPALITLVLGDNAPDNRLAQALTLGARGYLLRESAPDALAHAIRAAQHGTLVLNTELVSPFLRALQRADADEREENQTGKELVEPLTARELEVLRLMTRGLPNKQIAAELFITAHTVKFHIRAILGKLGAANRTEAVTLALHKGLVSL